MKPFLNRTLNISNRNVLDSSKSYIIARDSCFITKKQLDSCIRVVGHFIKRFRKKKTFRSTLQFNIPITKKSKGSRMGSGKGKIKEYISKVKKNEVLFIFQNVKSLRVFKIYKQLKVRLPVKIYLSSTR